MNQKRPYLIENRLSDVLSLIQVLSLDKCGHRSERGLNTELQGKPKSSENWTLLAKSHPEFFRVAVDNEHKVSLVARHVIEKNEQGIRELSPDLIKKLIEVAIELHDRQKERSDWWKIWIPIITVVIAGVLNAFITITTNKNELQQNQVWIYKKDIPIDHFQITIPKDLNKKSFETHVNRNYELPAFITFNNGGIETKIEIYDDTYLDKIVKKKKIEPIKKINNSKTFDITELKPGSYFVNYFDCNNMGVFKLTIE